MGRSLAAAAGALFLAACTALPPAGETPARPQRASIDRFYAEARVAVRSAEQSFSGRMSWRHEPAADEILVSSPLGQGLARLSGGQAGAVLETADRQRFVAADIEALSAQVFGLSLPLAGMARWIVGRPAAGEAQVETDELGRARFLEQLGWRIDYADYESAHADALPQSIRLEREGLHVRLVLDRWELP